MNVLANLRLCQFCMPHKIKHLDKDYWERLVEQNHGDEKKALKVLRASMWPNTVDRMPKKRKGER